MVVGSRLHGQVEKGAMSWTHLLGNRIFNTMINLLNHSDISDSQSGFRAIARGAFMNLRLSSKGFEIETEMTVQALRNGLRVRGVPITYRGRRGPSSKPSGSGAGMSIFKTILRCSLTNRSREKKNVWAFLARATKS